MAITIFMSVSLLGRRAGAQFVLAPHAGSVLAERRVGSARSSAATAQSSGMPTLEIAAGYCSERNISRPYGHLALRKANCTGYVQLKIELCL
jgi:hypothetical protein